MKMKTAIKVEEAAEMSTLPLKVVLDLVLASRTPAYVDTLLLRRAKKGWRVNAAAVPGSKKKILVVFIGSD